MSVRPMTGMGGNKRKRCAVFWWKGWKSNYGINTLSFNKYKILYV